MSTNHELVKFHCFTVITMWAWEIIHRVKGRDVAPINTFVKLTSSWQAGSISAKKYLAGASMPATSGMQHVSLAKVDGSMCCFSICGQFSHVLLLICRGILTDAMQSCTCQAPHKPILSSLFSLVPQLQNLYFLSFPKCLESTLTSENWTFDVKRTEFMLKGRVQAREQTDRPSGDRDGEKKKQWRVRIRNRWNISDCSNASSTM